MNAMHAERRTPAVLLAVLYNVSGMLCLFAADWPMRQDTPVGVLWALGTTGVLGGVALRLFAGRLRPWVLHAGVVLAGSLLGVLAWHSVTAVGVVSLGPVVIALGL